MTGAAFPLLPPDTRLLRLEEVDSTNAHAMRLAAGGETGPLWIHAAVQTRGRGRSGRSWSSPAGNLHASLLLRLSCPPASVHQLSLLTGVAVVDAVREAARGEGQMPGGLRLKWPNDVLIGSAKFVGILPESSSGAGGAGTLVVIGVGINLASHPQDLGRPLTHLAAHGIVISPDLMLMHLATAMHAWLAQWDSSRGFAAVRDAWLKRAGPIGEPISINAGSGPVYGRFAGLDSTGALLVGDPAGDVRSYTYGDVTLGAGSQ